MLGAANNGDWAGILATVVGFVLVTLSGLIAYIFHDLRKEVRTLNRHVDSIMTNLWEHYWRLDAVEDHLEPTGFRPHPRRTNPPHR